MSKRFCEREFLCMVELKGEKTYLLKERLSILDHYCLRRLKKVPIDLALLFRRKPATLSIHS